MLLPFFHNKFCEAGLDEAGRGCFAGPVFAAAVILPKDFYHPALNDSKQMKKEDREMLRPIIEKESISWSVAKVDNDEIDRINILQASFKAMHISLNRLKYTPELDEYDIGFRFMKKHWNKGYATEAALACIEIGFNKFQMKSIVGRAMKENIASIKVLQKIGLTYYQDRICGNADGVVYKIVK